jgi:two-component system nitrate/nitrite response regulator NarL
MTPERVAHHVVGSMMAITLLIVDDQPNIRRAVRQCLALEPDVRVVGEAGDGAEALTLASNLHPDVVLLDIKMGSIDGFDVAEEVHHSLPGTRVIFLTVHDTAANREHARQVGASGFVAKHEPAEVLLAAILGSP